jgi:hypothetical protein
MVHGDREEEPAVVRKRGRESSGKSQASAEKTGAWQKPGKGKKGRKSKKKAH